MSTGLVDEADIGMRLSPPATVRFSGATPVSFPDARGTGLTAGVDGLLCTDGLRWETGGPPTLACAPMFAALSDEPDPQPDSPARSIRLRNIARHDRDGYISSDHFSIELSV